MLNNQNIEILSLPNLLHENLPKRSRTAHKGDFGHALIIGGDCGMGGAVRLAAEAAARAGAGLVSILTHTEHIPGINSARPEIMCHDGEKDTEINELLTKCNVIVIGSGLGQKKWGQNLWHKVINSGVDKFIVVDADALNLLAKNPKKSKIWILTPHLGEAARLLGTTTTKVQNDRCKAVQDLQQKYGGICILKGTGTLICDSEQKLYICPAGNPGMASGGMGDILSGIIGGLLAQGLKSSAAAKLGVMLHSSAGDLAAKECGERGLLALDLLPYLRKISNF